jgi:hypothetical protein
MAASYRSRHIKLLSMVVFIIGFWMMMSTDWDDL